MGYRINLLAISAVVSLGAGASLALAGGHYVVAQSKLQFSARDLVIARGSTVTFKNNDRTSHNILIPLLRFDGGLQKPGQDINVAFAKAGAYRVTCGIHPKMALTVRVQ
jgi:plastocyanin